MTLNDKLEHLRQTVEREQIESLHRRKLACEANLANARARLVPGRKYTKVDIGNPDRDYWQGHYMVENETGRIYGIKGYGKVHVGHYYGTLDEVDSYRWDEYAGHKRAARTGRNTGCRPVSARQACADEAE